MNPFFIHSDAQSRADGGDVTTSSSNTSFSAAALPRASTAPIGETRQRSSSQYSWEEEYERERARATAPPPGDDGAYSEDEQEQGRGYWRRGVRAPPAESEGDVADGAGLRAAAAAFTFGDDSSNAGDAPGGSATVWDDDVAAGSMRPDGRPAVGEDQDFGGDTGLMPDGKPDFDAELDYIDPTIEGYDDRLANFREACKAAGIPAYAECGMMRGGSGDDPASFERHPAARFVVMQCVDIASAHGLTREMFESAMYDWPKHEVAKAWATKAREVRLGGKQLTRRAPRTQERSEAPAPRGGHKNNRPRPSDFYVQRSRANYDFPAYYPYKGKRGPPAPKPTADSYSRGAFRGWVAHKAATAAGNGPVTYNDATAALMGNFQGTRKALVECLDHAVVRRIDAAADPFPRGREATLHVRF